ncbi:D-glycero-beta-D-manno-heptose 1-phosphate adenylyltransferase [soil metagenome]
MKPLPSKIILDHKELATRLREERSSGRIVFTNGCFDLLHVGHIRYLQEARSLGDRLVVALNTDASVQKLKGPSRPVQQELDRAEIMAALACVDYVTLFDEETPLKVIELLGPDILVKGGDWSPDKIVGSSFVLGRGGEVKSLAFQPGRSTSSIIEKIKS